MSEARIMRIHKGWDDAGAENGQGVTLQVKPRDQIIGA